jgi:hypothetical protein
MQASNTIAAMRARGEYSFFACLMTRFKILMFLAEHNYMQRLSAACRTSCPIIYCIGNKMSISVSNVNIHLVHFIICHWIFDYPSLLIGFAQPSLKDHFTSKPPRYFRATAL